MSKLPNCFLLGAPRCGTTALATYLSSHPNIAVSNPKETHFYATDLDPRYRTSTTRDSYAACFAHATDASRVIIDASVTYLNSLIAPARIQWNHPDAKFIIMLRHPVDAAHSLHAQCLYMRFENEPDFQKAWALQSARAHGRRIPRSCREPTFLQYASTCRFGEQIPRYLDKFPRDHFHFILLDDLRRNPRETYLRLLSFLDIPDDGRTTFPIINNNKESTNPFLATMLLTPHPYLGRALRPLKRIIGLKHISVTTLLAQINTRQTERSPLKDDFRAHLNEYFAHDISTTEKLTGLSISSSQTPGTSKRHA